MTKKAPARKREEMQPRRYSSEAKRPTLTFRVRGDLYEQLKASAEAREMSLSEEIEHRLSVSVTASPSPFDEYISRSVSEAIKRTQDISGKRWVDNSIAALMCYNAVQSVASVMLAGHDYSEKNSELVDIAKRTGDLVGINAARKYASTPLREIEAGDTEGFMSFMRDVVGLNGDEVGRLRKEYEEANREGAGGLGTLKENLDMEHKLSALD